MFQGFFKLDPQSLKSDSLPPQSSKNLQKGPSVNPSRQLRWNISHVRLTCVFNPNVSNFAPPQCPFDSLTHAIFFSSLMSDKKTLNTTNPLSLPLQYPREEQVADRGPVVLWSPIVLNQPITSTHSEASSWFCSFRTPPTRQTTVSEQADNVLVNFFVVPFFVVVLRGERDSKLLFY
jgi:hypothetical protein